MSSTVKQKTIGYQAPQFSGCGSILELGPAFRALVEKYKREVAGEEPGWYEKCAVLYFMYEGRPYCVGAGTLETDGACFACIERKLTDDLYALGAYEMFYAGMMD